MCNWGWLGGPIPGLLMQNQINRERADDANASEANMARANELQKQLDQKTKDLNSAVNTGDAVDTSGRVLDPEITKKQTIKSLNIPLNNSGSSGSGLNL